MQIMIRLIVHTRDPQLLPVLSGALRPDFDLRVESDEERLKELAFSGQVDVVILDLDSGEKAWCNHLALYDRIETSGVPIVLMSDDETGSMAAHLISRAAGNYVRKPPSLVEVRIILRRAHELASIRRELTRLNDGSGAAACDQFVGNGKVPPRIYELMRRVADLDAFLLITGEWGTGKELVARAIHSLSHRAGAPFLAVSCGAIPDSLFEAELFGNENGPYPGDVGRREGYMERAGQGTLFLNEIGDLSLDAQGKLLRVLQQREFRRQGSTRLLPMRARLVFGTDRNLAQMVTEGMFRSDLYYRINVVQINIPPLRERTEEIPVLASHFLEQYTAIYGKMVTQIVPNALEELRRYDWPGNIRELENVIARAILMTETDVIGSEDLPDSMRLNAAPHFIASATGKSSSFEQQLREYKVKLANRAIQECNGNKTLAAKSLKMSRGHLHRLLRGGNDEEPGKSKEFHDVAS
jgi:DNA-binding NtrC family response regulator